MGNSLKSISPNQPPTPPSLIPPPNTSFPHSTAKIHLASQPTKEDVRTAAELISRASIRSPLNLAFPLPNEKASDKNKAAAASLHSDKAKTADEKAKRAAAALISSSPSACLLSKFNHIKKVKGARLCFTKHFCISLKNYEISDSRIKALMLADSSSTGSQCHCLICETESVEGLDIQLTKMLLLSVAEASFLLSKRSIVSEENLGRK